MKLRPPDRSRMWQQLNDPNLRVIHLNAPIITRIKGTSMDREVIHEHFHHAHNNVREDSSHLMLEHDRGIA